MEKKRQIKIRRKRRRTPGKRTKIRSRVLSPGKTLREKQYRARVRITPGTATEMMMHMTVTICLTRMPVRLLRQWELA